MAAGLGKQFLNLSLSACVLTLGELLVADTSLSIEKVKRRPIDVVECIPDRVLIVDGEGEVDMNLPQRRPHIIYVLFEIEFGRMNANHHQTQAEIFCRPRADVGQRSAPIYAGISPKLNNH